MRSIRILTLALLPALAVSPAFARDTTDTSTAAGKRFAVVGSYTHLDPKSDVAPGLKADGGAAPTISASWYATDNLAVELWGAVDKFNHRVRADGIGKIGTVEQPLALSGQWHFGQPENVFRPFVGLGYYESNFSNEDIAGVARTWACAMPTARSARSAWISTSLRPWFARTDVRYMHARPEVRVAGEGTGKDLKLDPWTVGIGLGARF